MKVYITVDLIARTVRTEVDINLDEDAAANNELARKVAGELKAAAHDVLATTFQLPAPPSRVLKLVAAGERAADQP